MTAADREPAPSAEGPRGVAALAQHRDVRQFGKFLIVGASSTAISFAVFALVYYALRLPAWLHGALAAYPSWQAFARDYHAAVILAEAVAFAIAVTNGFYWNRRWTFAHARKTSAHRQYGQFVLVNVVGLTLDLIISATTRLLHPIAGDFAPLLAKAVATGTVVFWNFLANKYWTFRD